MSQDSQISNIIIHSIGHEGVFHSCLGSENTEIQISSNIQGKSSNLVPSENYTASDRGEHRRDKKQGPAFSKLLNFEGTIKKLHQSLSIGLWSGGLRGTQGACRGSSVLSPEGVVPQKEMQVGKKKKKAM